MKFESEIMNHRKLTELFASARTDAAPVLPKDFAQEVLREIRRQPPAVSGTVSLFDQLSLLFPRIALMASAIIVLCIVLDYGLTAVGVPSLSDGAAQLSVQSFMTPTGF